MSLRTKSLLRLWIFAAMTMLAATSMVRPAAATTTTWKVKIDVSNGALHYTVQGNNNNCGSGALQADPPTITICADDTVKFVAHSKGDQHELALVLPDKVLGDKRRKPRAHFHSSDQTETTGGQVVKNPPTMPAGGYKYYIIVIDKQDGKMYTLDPKIIIGGHPVEDKYRQGR
jgi:hypothetical protein